MPTIANYPDGIGTAGPTIDALIDDPIDYQRLTFQGDDGSATVNIQPCGIQIITLEYGSLTPAEVAVIRDHYNLAKGGGASFSFYNRRTATLSAGWKYLSLARGVHRKNWSIPLQVRIYRYK